jgi:hypothetical protein
MRHSLGINVTPIDSLEAQNSAGVLSERDRNILDFECAWWQQPGGKEEAIRQTFGLSPARYFQLLNELIDRRVALEYDPLLVKRLLRIREERRQARQRRMSTPASAEESPNA